MPRVMPPAALLAVLLMVTPGSLRAQRIAPPCSSSVWSSASAEATADSARRRVASGWTQAKGAATGGVIGALAGMAAGLWLCNRFGAGVGTSCGGNMVWGAALVGGLGLVLGSLAGAEAEGRGP